MELRKKPNKKGKFVFKVKDKKTWLESRGGRTERDVKYGKKGEYVLMGSGQLGKWSKVYLPLTFKG